MVEENSASVAYDRFAPFYDKFNPQNDYEYWVGEVLLPELRSYGMKDGWALDVGCGTARAFDPLLLRGWKVVGCDASRGMIQEAAKKYGGLLHGRDFQLKVADARELPDPDRDFHLVLALNDVVNYLTDDGDLERCFRGMKRNLAPGGLVCFDVNTLGLMRTTFAGAGMTRGQWTWRGLAEQVEAGGTYEAKVSAPQMEASVHRQRHWTEEEVRGALDVAGLSCFARLGQREDGDKIVLSDPADEERDAKVVYIGGHHDG